MACFDASPGPLPRAPDGATGWADAQASRLRTILDGAVAHAILTLDAGGRVTGWNTGAERLTGRPGDAALPSGEDRAATPPPDALPQTLCRAVESGRAPVEQWIRRADGRRFWASGVAVPLGTDEAAGGFLVILCDRTAEREAAEGGDILLVELGHRERYVLATVRALVALTRRGDAQPTAFHTPLDARLEALARSHEAALRGVGDAAALRELWRRPSRPMRARWRSVACRSCCRRAWPRWQGWPSMSWRRTPCGTGRCPSRVAE